MRMNAALVGVIIGLGWLASQPVVSTEAAFHPVTEEISRNPRPGDWLHWRRTLDGWGFSPLTQITTKNVKGLQLVWSATLEAGASQAAPIAYEGVMYMASPGGVVQALDGATGDTRWEYRRTPAVVRRNLAIYDDKIIVNTVDAHILALDARTGKLVWETTVADNRKGYSFSSGAIVVEGKAISGLTGCGRYKDDVCYITAHDVKTGKEAWRTSTIARPGEPGGDTWGNLGLNFRAGGDAWIPGSYDPEARLIYWGVAQAKPWTRVQRGTDGDALYTGSTLALDPDTGRIAWYFQHLPGETHDLDEVFESLLINDGGRRSLFKMGKLGVMWELDRRSGQFLSAHDLGYQTLVTIDSASGKALYRAEMIPKLNQAISYCPGPGGFKNLTAMAYHPATKAFYIPLSLTCTEAVFGAMKQEDGGGGTGPAARSSLPHPASPKDIGEFVAMDKATGRLLWRHRQPAPFNSAALTTGGGLVFVGDYSRRFTAFDAASGARLWETRTTGAPQGFPISYSVGGRQFIAVVSGPGTTWNLINVPALQRDAPQPKPGSAIHVFALPSGQAAPIR